MRAADGSGGAADRSRRVLMVLACLIGEDTAAAGQRSCLVLSCQSARQLSLSLARARALSLSVPDSTAPPAALVPCCDSTARTDTQGNKPRRVERLPVALVFWYMPDSGDPKSATPFWHGIIEEALELSSKK